MPWLKVTLPASGAALPTVEAVLEDLGASVVTVLPQGDELPWEPAPGATPQASHNWVSALFPLDFDGAGLRAVLEGALSDDQVAALTVDFVADEDWSQNYRQYAVAERFGERLWLLPRDAEPAEGPCVRLDPGLAFGTGSHPTTRLCLHRLAGLDLTRARILDYGCGSGVLGLAALALGAAQVVAIDYDPQALLATRDNADYNGVSTATAQAAPTTPAQLVVATPGELAQDQQFDMIVANILANPLIELAPRLQGHLAVGGRLLLAGLLDEQATDVMAAYPEVQFRPVEDAAVDGPWRLLEATR